MRLIHVDSLKPGMIPARDVFPPTGGDQGIPLVREHTPLTPFMIEELREREVRAIHITDRVPRVPAFPSILPQNLHIPTSVPAINPTLRNEAIGSLRTVFQGTITGQIHKASQIVKHLDQVVGQLVDSLDNNDLVNINDLKDYDEYTYHHSLSVAVLAIAIGQHFGYDREELNQLGKCAILHDIGKTAIPTELLNKPDRLTDEEFARMKSHSTSGYDYLVKEGIGSDRIWEGVLCHHEKVDGTGYPCRIEGNDIPIWSRIVSVADVYDALTSIRPYRAPMQPAEAIEYIMGGVETSFDYDVVSSFVQKVEIYPVGSCVELSTGALAIVLNTRHTMRPVVRDMGTGEIYDLYSDRQMLSVVITRLLPEGALQDIVQSQRVQSYR